VLLAVPDCVVVAVLLIVVDALDDAVDEPVEVPELLCEVDTVDEMDVVALDVPELVCVLEGDVISQLYSDPSRYMSVKLLSAAVNAAH
jgi:hypothetical protein